MKNSRVDEASLRGAVVNALAVKIGVAGTFMGSSPSAVGGLRIVRGVLCVYACGEDTLHRSSSPQTKNVTRVISLRVLIGEELVQFQTVRAAPRHP